MSNINTTEIEGILEFSKVDNLKYLDNVLKIKDISDFDVDFIMSRLNLNTSVISLITSALEQYSTRKEIYSLTSYNDYLYRVVRNIELLENSSNKLSEELNKNSLTLKGFKTILDLIIEKAIYFPEQVSKKSFFGNFKFSKIYLDN